MADTFLVKGIKPNKLKIDAVRLELLNELRAEGNDDKKLLERTVRNFRGRKPRFEVQIGLSGNDASVLVGPTGDVDAVEKWTRLNYGVRPHTIRAKRAPYLVFRLGYNRGTRPGTLETRRSYYVGNHWRKAKSVRHRGFEGTDWTGVVEKMRKKPYQRRMMVALNRGLEKGGWN